MKTASILGYREDGGIVDIEVIPCKDSGKYRFINMSARHICECEFNSLDEALIDLLKYKNKYKKLEISFVESP